MAKSAVVKEVKGKVIVKENGKEVALSAGSIVDDVNNVVAIGDNSKAILVLPNGSEKVVESLQTLSSDTADVLASVSDLQAQILDGDDLTDLEATAAGGAPAGGGASGNGVSLGAVSFDVAGRESTVLGQTDGAIASQIDAAEATNTTVGATNVAAGTPVAAGADTTPPALSKSDIDVHTTNDSVDYGRAFVSLPNDTDVATATVSYTPATGSDAGNEQTINLTKGADGWSADSATPDGVSVVDGKVVFEAGVVKNDTPIKATVTDEASNTTAPAVEKTYNWVGQNDDGGLIVPVPLSSFNGEVDTNAVVVGFSSATALKDYANKIENDKFSAKAGEFKVVDGWYMATDGSALIAGEHAKALIITTAEKFDSYKDVDALVLKSGLSADVAIFGANSNDNITVDGVTVKYIYTGTGDDAVNLINGAKVSKLNTGSGDDSVSLENGSVANGIKLGTGDDSLDIKSGSKLIAAGSGDDIFVDREGITKINIDGNDSKIEYGNIYVAQGSTIKVTNGAQTNGLEGASKIILDNGAKVGGHIIMSDGDNFLSVKNNSEVSYLIKTNGGNDRLEFENVVVKSGIHTNAGDDYISAKDTEFVGFRKGGYILNPITTNDGNDTVVIDNVKLHNLISLGKGDDTLIVKSTSNDKAMTTDGKTQLGIYGNEGDDVLIKNKDTYYEDRVGANSFFDKQVLYKDNGSDVTMKVQKGNEVKLNPSDLLDIGAGSKNITLEGKNFKLDDNTKWTKHEETSNSGKSEYQAESDGKTFTVTIDENAHTF